MVLALCAEKIFWCTTAKSKTDCRVNAAVKQQQRKSLLNYNKKLLKNVGPIRHCEPPHAALPFTRCRYCRVARRLRIDVHDDDDDDNDNA